MTKVILHGRFAKFHEGPIEIKANTVFEIVEAISRQLDGFKPNAKTGKARIRVVGYDTEDSLHQDIPEGTTLHIVPQLNGGKSGSAWLQILAGAALIGVSFMLPGGSLLASLAVKAGMMLVLGGLSQLLAPAPEEKDENIKNRYLGAPGNTVQIGTRIPILYGEDRVYGHYLSFDINSQEFRGSAQAAASSGK